jgi:DNA-binding MarR family transcriptional regulator
MLGDEMVVSDNELSGSFTSAGALLREVARLHVRAQRERVECCDTTVAQCHILTELERAGPLPMVDLGRRLALDKGWISRGVASLAKGGLVTRNEGKDDGRVVVVALSTSGRRRVAELNRALDDQAARVMGRIASGQRRDVTQALRLLRDALRDEIASAAGCSRDSRRARRGSDGSR